MRRRKFVRRPVRVASSGKRTDENNDAVNRRHARATGETTERARRRWPPPDGFRSIRRAIAGPSCASSDADVSAGANGQCSSSRPSSPRRTEKKEEKKIKIDVEKKSATGSIRGGATAGTTETTTSVYTLGRTADE